MGYKDYKIRNSFVYYWIRFVNLFNINRGIVLVYENISLTKREYAMYFIGIGMGVCLTLLILSIIALIN